MGTPSKGEEPIVEACEKRRMGGRKQGACVAAIMEGTFVKTREREEKHKSGRITSVEGAEDKHTRSPGRLRGRDTNEENNLVGKEKTCSK